MLKYEDCICDPDNHDTKLELAGAGVIVTHRCRDCSNEVYDTNYTVDEVIEYLEGKR